MQGLLREDYCLNVVRQRSPHVVDLFSYYANGQLQSYTTTGSSTQAFQYDGAKRLTQWTNNGVITSYVYDLAGNLKNPHGKTLNFNEANEIIGFTYDGAGNLLQDDKYNYEWNGEGQLTKVTKPDGSLTVTYTYDPNGLRKTKTVSNTGGTKTYKYYYDGTNLIRVTDGTKTLWTYTWANNKPVSMTDENGFTYYLMTNYRGDVVKIVGISGAEAASYTYDPWGKLLSNEPAGKLANQPLRYASYVYDTETGLYNLQARYYDSDTARFISRDPDGGDKTNPLSQNLYAYANADPVNNVDRDGKLSQNAARFFQFLSKASTITATSLSIVGLAVTLSPAVITLAIGTGVVGVISQYVLYKTGVDPSKENLLYAIASFPIFSALRLGSVGRLGLIRFNRNYMTLSPEVSLFEGLTGAAFGVRGLGYDPFYYGYPTNRR